MDGRFAGWFASACGQVKGGTSREGKPSASVTQTRLEQRVFCCRSEHSSGGLIGQEPCQLYQHHIENPLYIETGRYMLAAGLPCCGTFWCILFEVVILHQKGFPPEL